MNVGGPRIKQTEVRASVPTWRRSQCGSFRNILSRSLASIFIFHFLIILFILAKGSSARAGPASEARKQHPSRSPLASPWPAIEHPRFLLKCPRTRQLRIRGIEAKNNQILLVLWHFSASSLSVGSPRTPGTDDYMRSTRVNNASLT